VLKGQAGVQRAIGELESQGYTVSGTEVTIQTPVGRTRVDIVARDPNGNLIFEVKNGPSARVNPNQQRVFQYIRQHGGTPVGEKAKEAGLPPGQPIQPTPIRVIQYP
jgi:streptogramin lyase